MGRNARKKESLVQSHLKFRQTPLSFQAWENPSSVSHSTLLLLNLLGSWFQPLRHAFIFMKVGLHLQHSSLVTHFLSGEVGDGGDGQQLSFFSYSPCPIPVRLSANINFSRNLCGFFMDLTGDHSIMKRLFQNSSWNNLFSSFDFGWNVRATFCTPRHNIAKHSERSTCLLCIQAK